jgi:hypothetical protein
MVEPLVRRPVWRDRLVWVWLLSLPLAYVAIFTFAERTQGLPADGAAEWARTAAIALGLWSVAALAGGIWLRPASRRIESGLVRLLLGRDGADAADLPSHEGP